MLEDNEVTRNQIAAAETWWDAFDSIIYFGDFDARISAENVSFYPTDGKPTIREMASVCAQQSGWTCIVNADIRIGNGFRKVEPMLQRRGARAAVSWRFQFDPAKEQPPTGRQTDWGVDWFAAKQDVWRAVSKAVPSHFRLGEILWDTWMLGAFALFAWDNLFDISATRTIFHPIHTIRNGSFVPTPEMHDQYVRAAKWPTRMIAL